MSGPKLYTIEETAEIFRCSTDTIYRRLREGKLAHVRPCGMRRTLIPAEEIEREIRKSTTPRVRERATEMLRLH